MKTLEWMGAAAGVYVLGAMVFAVWLDRWDLAHRPASGRDLTRAGMASGFRLAACAYGWILFLAWLVGNLIGGFVQ